MNRAGLEFAKLPDALLRRADLSMATPGGAYLTGADFANADLTSTRLKDVMDADQTNLVAARNLPAPPVKVIVGHIGWLPNHDRGT